MNKIPISQIVLVEGKYDKITLENIIDATIIICNGFGIFKDEEKKAAIRKMAKERGAIILTDSDSAGAKIRSYLSVILQGAEVYPIYFPAIEGKERRKASHSKEGLLGVEGMDSSVLREAFLKFEAKKVPSVFSANDLYSMGFTGRPNSKEKKEKLLSILGLPPHLSNNALIKELDRRVTLDELEAIAKGFENE